MKELSLKYEWRLHYCFFLVCSSFFWSFLRCAASTQAFAIAWLTKLIWAIKPLLGWRIEGRGTSTYGTTTCGGKLIYCWLIYLRIDLKMYFFSYYRTHKVVHNKFEMHFFLSVTLGIKIKVASIILPHSQSSLRKIPEFLRI